MKKYPKKVSSFLLSDAELKTSSYGQQYVQQRCYIFAMVQHLHDVVHGKPLSILVSGDDREYLLV